MRDDELQPVERWIIGGGLVSLIGAVIILWPRPGWAPDPLPFPPAAAAKPIAGYAVLGYPLFALGLLSGGVACLIWLKGRSSAAKELPPLDLGRVLALRGRGASWGQIARAVGALGEAGADELFRRLAAPQSPEGAVVWESEVYVRWRCETCAQMVTDFGLMPDRRDREQGHADTCTRNPRIGRR